MNFNLPVKLKLDLIEHSNLLCNILIETKSIDKKSLIVKEIVDVFDVSEDEVNELIKTFKEKKDSKNKIVEDTENELFAILNLLNISTTKTVRNYEMDGENKKVDNDGKYIVINTDVITLDYPQIKNKLSALKSKLNKENKGTELDTSN